MAEDFFSEADLWRKGVGPRRDLQSFFMGFSLQTLRAS